MKTLFAVVVVVVAGSLLSGCVGVRGMLASSSAHQIRSCKPEELQVSDTSNSGSAFAGPTWTAVCHQETYRCTGYPQFADSVKCKRIQ